MKKIFSTLIFLMNLVGFVYAQKWDDHQIELDFEKVATLKVDYEKYRGNPKKGDSLLKLYKNQINKIKISPDIYLKYINSELRSNKTLLKKETLLYKSLTVEANSSLKRFVIKKIDFYRVIKYSLFKKGDEILPLDFHGLPVVDENNYRPKYGPKPTGYKLALRFILDSVGFNSQEKKMLKKAKDPAVIMEIKEYLNEKDLNLESKEFLKWALRYLTTPGNNLSIGHLEGIYKIQRDQNYVPKDRESTNQD